MRVSGICPKANTMHVIEDEGKLRFFEGKEELTSREGFARLERIYGSEPQEVKRIINKLREKYGRLG